MNPGAVLFPVMYDLWVAMLKSLECGCLSTIGSGTEMEMMMMMEKMMKKPRLGRYPMGPTTRPSALGMSDSVIVGGFHLNCGII